MSFGATGFLLLHYNIQSMFTVVFVSFGISSVSLSFMIQFWKIQSCHMMFFFNSMILHYFPIAFPAARFHKQCSSFLRERALRYMPLVAQWQYYRIIQLRHCLLCHYRVTMFYLAVNEQSEVNPLRWCKYLAPYQKCLSRFRCSLQGSLLG